MEGVASFVNTLASVLSIGAVSGDDGVGGFQYGRSGAARLGELRAGEGVAVVGVGEALELFVECTDAGLDAFGGGGAESCNFFELTCLGVGVGSSGFSLLTGVTVKLVNLESVIFDLGDGILDELEIVSGGGLGVLELE